MPNFSSVAGLEVPEKFGVGWGGWWGGFQVSTVSNPTKLLLQLLWVELRWVLTIEKVGRKSRERFFNSILFTFNPPSQK